MVYRGAPLESMGLLTAYVQPQQLSHLSVLTSNKTILTL